MSTLQRLPETFTFGGFKFQQIQRQGDVAIFSKQKPGRRVTSYEVVIIQKHKEHKWPNGKTTPAWEAMPANEVWGISGWTYPDLVRGERRFADLIASRTTAKHPAVTLDNEIGASLASSPPQMPSGPQKSELEEVLK